MGVIKMKILIGTKNPGKIEGAKQAFEKYFDEVEIEGISVDSNVGDQPKSRNYRGIHAKQTFRQFLTIPENVNGATYGIYQTLCPDMSYTGTERKSYTAKTFVIIHGRGRGQRRYRITRCRLNVRLPHIPFQPLP